MKLTSLHVLCTILVWLPALTPAVVAEPKPGRYKGTLSVRTVVDGTKAEVKKVIPVAGILAAGKLQFVLTDLPPLNSFTNHTFNSAISDGAVTLFPNGNAQTITFSPAKTTGSSIKGTVDMGLIDPPPTGGADVRLFIDLAVTRVGN
jgi:hypothetical protein